MYNEFTKALHGLPLPGVNRARLAGRPLCGPLFVSLHHYINPLPAVKGKNCLIRQILANFKTILTISS
jgi:hypothetical protein